MAYDLLTALHGIEGGLFHFDREICRFQNSSTDATLPLLFSTEERRHLEKPLLISSYRLGLQTFDKKKRIFFKFILFNIY